MSNDGSSLQTKKRPRKAKVHAPKTRARRLSQSVPPPEAVVPVDLPHEADDLAARFFAPSQVDAPHPLPHPLHAESHAHDAAPDAAELRARMASLHTRRAKLGRYVRVAVSVAALVCFAAVVRGAIARVRQSKESTASALVADLAHTSIAREARAAVAPPVAPAPAAPTPDAAPATPDTLPDTAPADVAPAKSAAEEKRAARVALERGHRKDAIAAGERSVALDPTDAEAWLLLGGAYQDSGQGAEARRAFRECTKQGKRGPVGECRLMLQ